MKLAKEHFNKAIDMSRTTRTIKDTTHDKELLLEFNRAVTCCEHISLFQLDQLKASDPEE